MREKLTNAENAWNEARNNYETAKIEKGEDHPDVVDLLSAFKEADDAFETAKKEAGVEKSEAETKQHRTFWDKLFGSKKNDDANVDDKSNDDDKEDEEEEDEKATKAQPKKQSRTKHPVIVALRVYAGIQVGQAIKPEIAKDSKGNVLNENQLVKLVRGSLEWKNYLATITNSNWFMADVEWAKRNERKVSAKEVSEIQEEVNAAFGITPDKRAKLDELQALKAKIEKIEREL